MSAVILFLFLRSSAESAPLIACKNPVYDFGTALNQSSVTHKFVLHNKGDSPLNITRIKTGCACTVAEIDRREVPAGEKATISVKFTFEHRLGRQDLTIFVSSNDPKTPMLKLSMKGKIRKDVEIKPHSIFSRFIVGDKPPRLEMSVVSGGETGFRIIAVETNFAPFLTADVLTVKEGVDYRVKFHLKDDAARRPERHQGTVVIRTDHPDHKVLAIPVVVVIDPEMLVTPAVLPVAEFPGNPAPSPRFLMVRSRKGKPFTIVKITPPMNNIGVKSKKRRPDQSLIRITNLRPSKKVDGKVFTILIKTSEGSEEILTVPVQLRPKKWH